MKLKYCLPFLVLSGAIAAGEARILSSDCEGAAGPLATPTAAKKPMAVINIKINNTDQLPDGLQKIHAGMWEGFAKDDKMPKEQLQKMIAGAWKKKEQLFANRKKMHWTFLSAYSSEDGNLLGGVSFSIQDKTLIPQLTICLDVSYTNSILDAMYEWLNKNEPAVDKVILFVPKKHFSGAIAAVEGAGYSKTDAKPIVTAPGMDFRGYEKSIR